MVASHILRSPRVLFLLLIATSFFGGWCVFNLQAVSIVSLLQDAGLQFLPFLMIFQAMFSWLLLKIWGNAALQSAQRFFMTALATGLMVSLIAHHPIPGLHFVGDSKIILYSLIFILSQLTVSALRMGIHVTFSKQISVLLNPQISVQLAIAEEGGFLVGILLLMLFPHTQNFFSITLSVAPFLLSFFIVAILWLRGRSNAKNDFLPNILETGSIIKKVVVHTTRNLFSASSAKYSPLYRLRRAPYLKHLILLFTAIATLKAFSWFGLAWGLDRAMKEGSQLLGLFSRLSLMQSVFTLGILVASLSFSKKIPTWGVGFKVLLGSQAGLFSLLALVPTWVNFLGAEVTRKVLEHGFLGRSLQLLTSSLPDDERLEMRHLMEKWSTTSGVALAGGGAFLVLYVNLPIQILFGAGVLLALYALKIRKRLFETLSDFHLAHLNRGRLSGVIQACHVLANPESKKHYAALVGLLERKPRPVVLKNALLGLGRMQNAKAIPAIQEFLVASREDVQLAAVRALKDFSGHEVNLTLLKLLRDLVRSDMAIRNSVVRILTQRLGRLAIPYLLELLESPPSDRVASNTVEILGEIAMSLKDEDLMSYLSRFLNPSCSRRLQANAIVALYGHSVFGDQAQECFDRLMTSRDEKSTGSFAYIAGILKLHGHEAVIWEMSEKCDHSNNTYLLALLRLGDPEAPGIMASWIVGENEQRSLEALVRLSGANLQVRSKVLFELTERFPQKLDLVLARMRASQRDFEQDRNLMREEARRIGLDFDKEQSENASLVGVDTVDVTATETTTETVTETDDDADKTNAA